MPAQKHSLCPKQLDVHQSSDDDLGNCLQKYNHSSTRERMLLKILLTSREIFETVKTLKILELQMKMSPIIEAKFRSEKVLTLLIPMTALQRQRILYLFYLLKGRVKHLFLHSAYEIVEKMITTSKMYDCPKKFKSLVAFRPIKKLTESTKLVLIIYIYMSNFKLLENKSKEGS